MIRNIVVIEKYLIEAILHEHGIQKRLELQSTEVQIRPIQALEASLVVTKSSGTESENFSSDSTFSRSENENRSSEKESSSSEGNDVNADISPSYDIDHADIGPSYDNDIVSEVLHDTFENVFAHGIQNHKKPESIPNTYVVNENNSNIIFDIPNMDPDRGKEEHHDVYYEQQRALFAFL
ncbi:hypothetical protein Tco_0192177, partial [Tanacetum coccineum]